MNTMNFMLGLATAKGQGLSQNQQVAVALTASQFSPNNLMGPILLKLQNDKLLDAKVERDSAQAQPTPARLRTVIPVEVRDTITLSIAGAAWSLEQVEGITLDSDGDLAIVKVGEAGNGKQAILSATVDGAVQQYEIRGVPASSALTGRMGTRTVNALSSSGLQRNGVKASSITSDIERRIPDLKALKVLEIARGFLEDLEAAKSSQQSTADESPVDERTVEHPFVIAIRLFQAGFDADTALRIANYIQQDGAPSGADVANQTEQAMAQAAGRYGHDASQAQVSQATQSDDMAQSARQASQSDTTRRAEPEASKGRPAGGK